eukprot:3007755-Ditylum_brightwellii.AAC.1
MITNVLNNFEDGIVIFWLIKEETIKPAWWFQNDTLQQWNIGGYLCYKYECSVTMKNVMPRNNFIIVEVEQGLGIMGT